MSQQLRPLADTRVTVIIPCHNQGQFLAEAVQSALDQTYGTPEVIVVDDGSTDSTSDVARRFSTVRYIHQANQGVAAARNAGIREGTGEFVVFLDADDRLLPNALAINVGYLKEHPAAAFVAGNYHYISQDGSVVTSQSPHGVQSDFYLELLKHNYVGMPATVMFRRELVQRLGGFDMSLRHIAKLGASAEDYDLYLRITREFVIACHEHVIAEYRRHHGGVSQNPVEMLRACLTVLERQKPYLATLPPRYKAAYARGRHSWRNLYGRELLLLIFDDLRRRDLRTAITHARGIVPHLAPAVAWQARTLGRRALQRLRRERVKNASLSSGCRS